METSRLRCSTRNRRKNKSPVETSIDDLPEAILLHILSFLPTPDAIRISAVGPPLHNLWKSLADLDFDMHDFQEQIPEKSNRVGRILFAEFVSQALRRRTNSFNRICCNDCCFPVQKFKLFFFYKNYDHIRSYVDSWVRRLVELKAVEIDLNFVHRGKSSLQLTNDDDEESFISLKPYEFRFYDIVASSIEVLKLSNCTLGFPRGGLWEELHSIKELDLGDYSGDSDEIEQLLDLCVNLDTFSLDYTGDDSHLKIVSRKLRRLTLEISASQYGTNSVEICTPRLKSIEINQFVHGLVYDLKHGSSLVEATVGFEDGGFFSNWKWWDFACWANVVSFFTGVERLTIYNIPQDEHALGSQRPSNIRSGFEGGTQVLKGAKVLSEISAFRNLRYLTLKMQYLKEDILSLEVLLNKCPRLETLVLVWDNFSHHYESTKNQKRQKKKKEIAVGLVALQIPRLREVKMEGYLGTKNELYVVDLLKKHGVVLEKIVAFPAKLGHIWPPPIVL